MRRSILAVAGPLAVLCVGMLGGCPQPSATQADQAADTSTDRVSVLDAAGAMETVATTQDSSFPFGQTLTAAQEDTLRELDDEFASGAIDEAELRRRLHEATGAGPMDFADAMHRGRGQGHHPFGPARSILARIAAGLDLTDEQRTQALAIFESLRDDVMALRDQAQSQIEALLTPEQQMILDELDLGRPGQGRCFGHGHPLARIVAALELSQEQQQAVRTILTTTQDAVAVRLRQALDEFRAILTAEQIAVLDEWLDHRPGNRQNDG